jgi:hypothetical protein
VSTTGSIWVIERRDKEFRGDESMWEPVEMLEEGSTKKSRAIELRCYRTGSPDYNHRAVEYVRRPEEGQK